MWGGGGLDRRGIERKRRGLTGGFFTVKKQVLFMEQKRGGK